MENRKLSKELNILYVPISELRPAEYNPRRWDKSAVTKLKESIQRFGMVDPIIVNASPNRKNVIIGGHFRWAIAKEMGLKEIPVVYVNIPNTEREKELNLRLNRNTGEWDWDLLAEFDEKLLLDVGFENEDLDSIFGLDVEEDFDVQKALDKAVKNPKGIKKGDLWQLGEHKLIIGDSTDRKNWKKLLENDRFDFMFTDPPYKLSYSTKRVRKIRTAAGARLKRSRPYIEVGETNAEGKVKGFGYKQNRLYAGVESHGGVPEFDEWLSIANDFQNPAGANVMIFENWRNAVELWQAIEKYWKIRNQIIWWLPNRCQGFSSKHKFFNKYDICPLADKGKAIKNEEYEQELDDYLNGKGQKLLDSYEVILYGQTGESYWDKKKGTRWATASDHITAPAETGKSSGQSIVFGTKPIRVLLPYIKILSPRNGIVMEPFCGSGSTIIGSEIMKRKCRAIELSPLYGEVIVNRWEKFTGLKAKKLS